MRYLDPFFALYSLFIRELSLVYIPRPIRSFIYKNFGRTFMRMNDADFDEIGYHLDDFRNLSEFFSRPLKSTSRAIGNNALVSPCDGLIQEYGKITNGTIIRVKGFNYTLLELITDAQISSKFRNGSYINIYLSPRNYHRFHIPCTGTIDRLKRIPGCCLPVNAFGRKEPKLYSLNERYIANISGKDINTCLVIVGAAAVRGIELKKELGNVVNKGDLLGMFKLGSSIILLTDEKIPSSITNIKVKACGNIY